MDIVRTHWRQAGPSDLPAIMDIAERIHPGLPERVDVYAEKLRLFPDGCRVLLAGEQIIGYGISHPWRLHQIPPLDEFLGQLPSEADCLYVHDVAVLPAFRGRETARGYIDGVVALARTAGIDALALVSVYGTQALWHRHGFRDVTSDEALRIKLRSYGETATYMIRDLRA